MRSRALRERSERRALGDQFKKMVSAPGRRKQVTHAEARGLSLRRACALLDVARSGARYESKRERKMREPSRRREPPASDAAERAQSRLGDRLRLRRVRRRSPAHVPHRHRRVDARVPRDRRRRRHSYEPRL